VLRNIRQPANEILNCWAQRPGTIKQLQVPAEIVIELVPMALISGLSCRPLDNDGKQQRLDIVISESELEGDESRNIPQNFLKRAFKISRLRYYIIFTQNDVSDTIFWDHFLDILTLNYLLEIETIMLTLKIIHFNS